MSVDDSLRSRRPSRQAGRIGHYGAKDIQVLEGLDPVRKRPACTSARPGWPASTTSSGRSSTTRSTRRWPATARASTVTLQADGGCRVDDDGRGIPVDPYPSGPHKGKSAAEVVLTVLHAGGKFGGNGYKVSGGLHGVGVSVVNALSERLIVEIDRDGQRYRQEYAKGGKPQGKMEVVGPTPGRGRTTGTTVTFWPDPTVFVAEGTEFLPLPARAPADDGVPQPWPRDRLRRRAPGQGAEGHVPVQGRPRRLRQAPQRLQGGAVLQGRHFEDDDEAQSLDVAIQWNTGYYEGIHGYANGISTTEGGMHVEGFRAALTTVVNKYARAKALLKEKEENLLGEDIREGITAIISVKLRDPQFEGQTKAKLGNVPMRSFVQKATNEQLAEWLEENPTEANRVVKKAHRRGPGPRGGQERPQRHPPQDGALGRRHARQAEGLLEPQRRGGRAVHRRGRLRRWHRRRRPRSAHAGDPADPRQDPQRRAGPRSTRC